MPQLSLSRFPLPASPEGRPLDIVNRGTSLAVIACHGKWRKDGVTPELLHPLSVQRLLARAGIEDERIHAAALLHDALEANPGPRGELLRTQIGISLGAEVLAMVDALTEPDAPELSRAERKALQLQRITHAPWNVKVIKLADVVASFQEGPAPNWSVDDAARYVHQRCRLVDQVLRPSSAALVCEFEVALAGPVWRAALAASGVGTREVHRHV